MKGNCGECERRYFCEIDPNKCDEWPDPSPMTNADRIRAMSDEELANRLFEIGWDCHCCTENERLENEPLLRGGKCDEDCAYHCLEWLRQPADTKEE